VPSIWWEIFGLVVSEAFMFRRPPICSNIGGMAERLRHDEDGLLFEAGDPISLAETLHRCVTEEGLQARLAANSPGVPAVSEVVRSHCEVYGIGGTAPALAAKGRNRKLAATASA
jgi:glycosyltransferase involved in cell wall biosynthesis